MSQYKEEMNSVNRGDGNQRQSPRHRNTQNYYQHQPRVVVEDLREKLNRKRQEQYAQGNYAGPPPDPKYNFLSDPDRDDPHLNAQNKRGAQRIGFNSRGRKGRAPQNVQDYLTHPMNIKVELSTSTGRRSYVLDEETKLPDMKHVPDRYERGYTRKREGRGRGFNQRRGQRGRSNPHFGNSQNRSSSTVEIEESWDAENTGEGEEIKLEKAENFSELNEETNSQETENEDVEEGVSLSDLMSNMHLVGSEIGNNNSTFEGSLAETIVIEPSAEKNVDPKID